MLLWVIIKVSLRSLLANKLRSFLAMLGIIIGVSSVITMLAVGAGAQKQVLGQISSMGTDLLVIRPGQRGMGGVSTGTQQTLKIEDAEAILDVKSVKAVAPVVGGNIQVKYMNKNSRTTLLGTSLTYFGMRSFEVEKGRRFTDDEAESLSRVLIIGSTTAENLFGTEDAINQTIKVNGVNFTVVGVLKSKGDQGFFNPDDQAIMPYKTAMKQLLGIDFLREVDIQADEGADLTKLQKTITTLLRKRHRIQEEEPEDFNIRNQAEALETASNISNIFTLLLGGIAGISLLVGGIGIMNIMLVTVTERTKEIGIRKAIGAKEKDILRQFLIEAIVMTSSGGFIGILIGIGLSNLITLIAKFPTIVSVSSIIVSVSFSIAVGVFFGYYPAKRAAKLDPIEALRYE